MTLADGRVRPTATLIYFLLPAGESSAWHRVRSDEVWLAHTGSVTLELGGTDQTPVTAATAYVGTRIGQQAQVVVPAGTWQRTLPSERDALVSCLVSPGFDFDDFELAPCRLLSWSAGCPARPGRRSRRPARRRPGRARGGRPGRRWTRAGAP